MLTLTHCHVRRDAQMEGHPTARMCTLRSQGGAAHRPTPVLPLSCSAPAAPGSLGHQDGVTRSLTVSASIDEAVSAGAHNSGSPILLGSEECSHSPLPFAGLAHVMPQE